MNIGRGTAISRNVVAFCLAIAASLVLFALLTAGGSTVRAQTDGTPTSVGGGPVVVWETAIPEDWPVGQVSHIIFTFEAFSADGGALTFALRETDDTAKFSLVPAGVNDAGNYLAQLQLKEEEELDYEAQDTYLIGVVVSTEGGASTEMLLRLRITDVEGDAVSPSPTASASPTPIATPTDPCFEAISGAVNIVRSWDSSCLSENRPNDGRAGDYYARFFTFTIDEAATVSITVNSQIDTYMYLMKGSAKDGVIEVENDDLVQYVNLNAGIEDFALDAGSYTIEATAYDAEKSGNFRLVVSGLPDAGAPQADCSTGGAVSNSGSNPDMVADCEMLLGLRDALSGTTLLNWTADTPIEDWDGVTVSGSPKRVTEVALDESGLNGEVPGGLGRLTALTVLSLSGNGLRGTVPAELGGLASLTELSIGNNQLTGSIPVELGGLADLETLALNGNRLSGVIPTELGELTNLITLLLADNGLTGEIPGELGALANLEELKLSGNRLSGCILAALQDVADNDLSLTGLEACASGACSTGSAVASPEDNVGLVSDCNALLAMKRALEGRASPLNWSADTSIEDWEGITVHGSPKRVTRLELNNRGLSGRIPTSLGALSELRILWLAENQLTGLIPTQIGGLSKMQWMTLSGNQLSGTIPPDMGDLTGLEIMNLNDNRLNGEIPPELSSLSILKTMYLQNNLLEGEIPSELGGLSKIEELNLSQNLFSGNIPSELGSLSSLETLDLGKNKLDGGIPTELGSLSNLEHLHLTGNRLSGEIPREFGSLEKLKALYLSANLLTGDIPPELGAIASLETIRLSGNDLGGCIPQELRELTDNDFVGLGLDFCDEGACAGGTAVENPNDNRGLVGDCQALMAAKDGLRGTVALDWSTETAIQNWEGVTVSGSPKRITVLNLSSKELDGTIPPELGNLAKLKTLNLSGNELTGEIPSELVKLANLEILILAGNRLSGQIPHELARLVNLKKIKLSGDDQTLTGCVPDELEDVETNDFDTLGLLFCGKIDCSNGSAVDEPDDNSDLVKDCEALLEARDKLSGAIYLNWSAHLTIEDWEGVTVGGTTKRVTAVMLDNKDLNGMIPTELGNLSGLEKLSLGSNHLSSEIPRELGRLASLDELNLSGNLLSGTIPSELGKLTKLKKLILDKNLLSGEIQPELGLLSNLEELKLAGNNLIGCVPQGLQDVSTNDFDMLGLEFCATGECSSGSAVEDPDANPGLVADCDALLAVEDALKGDEGFLNWSADVDIEEWIGVEIDGTTNRITKVTLNRLRLSGEIPAELSGLSKLETLTMTENRLSGEIPSELSRLYELETLSLSGNRLSGGIPPELGRLSNLETLSLSDNQLSGEIPAELGNLTSLKYLYLYDNQLSGAIPVNFESLTSLLHLYIYDNHLTGEIPSELGKLTNLRHLHLTDNGLSGAIPTELGSLSALVNLHISDNQLTGSIPSELGDLSNLQELYLKGNQLTGDIPSELGDLSNLEELYLFGNQLTGCIPEELRDVANNDLSLLNLPDCAPATGRIAIPGGLRAVFEDLLQRAPDTPFLRREIVGLHSFS